MRKISLILMSLVAIFGLGYSLVATSTASGRFSGDKDREADYKAAAAATTAPKGGCKTMPFSWASSCPTMYTDMKKICDTKRSCSDQIRPLTDAIKRGLKDKIQEIHDICEARRKIGVDCESGRTDVQALFARANREVEREKTHFETELRKTKDSDEISLYRSLIGYSDIILAYYAAGKTDHEDELAKVGPVTAECTQQVKRASDALK